MLFEGKKLAKNFIHAAFLLLLPKESRIALEKTQQQYQKVVEKCKTLFLKKAKDYGTAWTILRMSSVTDQIGIKAHRIRTLQETGENMVGDSIESEFVGIINYCIIALILLEMKKNPIKIENIEALTTVYEEGVRLSYETMLKKNHDYGEVWRKMRISSMTDLILMKILRLKQIEDNKGLTLVSEGVEANYIDIMNYAVFCLILGEEGKEL